MGTLTQLFSYYQDVFHQYQERMLEDELWESRRTNLVAYLGAPGVRKFWKRRGAMFTTSFRAFVDAELAIVASGERDSGDAAI